MVLACSDYYWKLKYSGIGIIIRNKFNLFSGKRAHVKVFGIANLDVSSFKIWGVVVVVGSTNAHGVCVACVWGVFAHFGYILHILLNL